jgi:adenylyltransferase/sulfurtransferase
MLTNEEKKQYNRHLILDDIGMDGQLKLKRAKVLVVGAGGLGCPILQYLTAAGVGTIGVLDHDVVDQSNLQRQVLYTHSDIGISKAEAAVNRLSDLNPYVKFNIHNEELQFDNAIEIFEEYDIIVDGTDNFPTRYLVSDAVVLTDKVLVFGSIFKFDGQVSVFNYKEGPTYRCLYPTPPEPDAVPNCSQIGVLGVLPGLIGCLQANEVIKIICNLGDILSGKLLTINALSLEQMIFCFEKNEDILIEKLEDNYDVLCGLIPGITELTLKEIQDHNISPLFIDVRSLEERNQDQIIESIHIPLEELESRINEISKDKTIVTFCATGIRSKKAIEVLINNSFKSQLISLKK